MDRSTAQTGRLARALQRRSGSVFDRTSRLRQERHGRELFAQCVEGGRYRPIPPLATAGDVWRAIGSALKMVSGSASHDEIVQALRAAAPSELALDCEHIPGPNGAAAILRLIDDLGEEIPLLVASQSRAAFDVARLVSRGTASLRRRALAFAVDEIRHLAETCGVRFAHADLVRLLEVTDGWPQVVSGTIRKAAEDSRGLYGAFDHWRNATGISSRSSSTRVWPTLPKSRPI